jgi:hypothetical protein
MKQDMTEGYSVVDGIIFLLKDPQLPEGTRQGLLLLLTNIISKNKKIKIRLI